MRAVWTRVIWLSLAAAIASRDPLLFADDGFGVVQGAVSIPGPDGQLVVVPGVTMTLTCEGAGRVPLTAVSDEQGRYQFDRVPAGTCALIAELQGFRSATQTIAVEPSQIATASLRLGLDTLTEEVTVRGAGDPVQADTIATHVERMTGGEMQTAPLANERFQDALPLIPGVVRGPDGLLNINGTRSNQSALMFNDADGTDPVTGEHALELPIDAVDSVQVRRAAYAPEFGQSVGAVTSVETRRAGESWHATVNDLEPRLRRRGGKFRGIESFTPRITLGGPLVPGRLSVLQSLQYELSRTQVFSLPPLESDTEVESVQSFSRIDWSPAAATRLTATATVSPRKTTYAGLNTFNPQQVTPTVENHGAFGTATGQVILGDRGVLETRASVKQFDVAIYPSSRGRGAMILAPDVNSGTYFNDQERASRRVEWANTYATSPFGPAHLLKMGAGVTYETFDGTQTTRPVEIVRADGTLAERITSAGRSTLGRTKTALEGFGQDAWTVSPRLTVVAGARYDYDSITGEFNVAPRGSITALLPGDGRTVMRGGFGVFHNPIPLNVAAFDQLQARIVTDFGPNGFATAATPAVVPNATSGLHAPRAIGWDVEVDREWMPNLFVRAGYRQRDSSFEAIVDPVVAAGSQVLQLRTDGQSTYREAQLVARYQFRGSDQIVASYTRSSAIGDLNDFNSYLGNVENPIVRPDERGPLPWDAPDRFLFWANLSLPRAITVFPLIDVRTGFPTSVVDELRTFVGPRNSGRFPTFVSLDTQITKRFRLFGHNATIGLKVFNVTNHFNPRDYQGNLASAGFGGFANGVGRTFRGKWVFEF